MSCFLNSNVWSSKPRFWMWIALTSGFYPICLALDEYLLSYGVICRSGVSIPSVYSFDCLPICSSVLQSGINTTFTCSSSSSDRESIVRCCFDLFSCIFFYFSTECLSIWGWRSLFDFLCFFFVVSFTLLLERVGASMRFIGCRSRRSYCSFLMRMVCKSFVLYSFWSWLQQFWSCPISQYTWKDVFTN